MSLMPLLIWFAACGADPNLVLPEESTSAGEQVLGYSLLSDSLSTAPTTASSPNDWQQSTFRAQSFTTERPEFELASPVPRGFHRDLIHDLKETFNPFGHTTVRVLPGYYDPYGWQGSYGINGYQPWRLGWSTFHEVAAIPGVAVSGGGAYGSMMMSEWNSNLRLSELVAPGIVFNGTGNFNAHYWSGPGGPDLPGQVDQLSTDLELGFFNDGPWSAQIAFHPQIVDGYESKLNRNAFNFDGRAIATYLASPHWSFVGGIAVWDRVDTMIIPYGGAIWTPDSHWELRLLFPRTKISYYLGRQNGKDFWVYGVAEYTAEAWQANIGDPTIVADRIQLTDDRVSIGFRRDSGRHSAYIEAGYVFNRQAKFAGPTPNFDLNNGVMIRAGFRF